MGKLLCSAAGAAALLAMALPSAVNASTLVIVTTASQPSVIITTAGSGTSKIAGSILDLNSTPLTYANDYIEFFIQPNASNAQAAVNALTGGFPAGTTYQIQEQIGLGPKTTVLGPKTANDTTSSLLLVPGVGIDYFLEFNTDGGTFGTAPQIGGWSVALTPLPGALALFAGGLGLLGFAGLSRSRKTGRGLAQVA